MTETMRAAVVTGPRRTVGEAMAIPAPGPGEVRVRIEGCGVCASNVVHGADDGAAETLALDDNWRIIEAVKALTGGRFCERVIEATGKQSPLDLAAELTAERGRLVVAGYHQDGPRQVNLQLWNWRGLDVINAHERDPAVYVHGVRRAVDAGGGRPARPGAAPHPQLSAGAARRSLGSDARPAGGIHEDGGGALRRLES